MRVPWRSYPREVYQVQSVTAGVRYDAAAWVRLDQVNGTGATLQFMWFDAAFDPRGLRELAAPLREICGW